MSFLSLKKGISSTKELLWELLHTQALWWKINLRAIILTSSELIFFILLGIMFMTIHCKPGFSPSLLVVSAGYDRSSKGHKWHQLDIAKDKLTANNYLKFETCSQQSNIKKNAWIY